jgi:hypothetical protein
MNGHSEPASTHPQRVHESTNKKIPTTVSGCENGSNGGISAGHGKSCSFNGFSPARGSLLAFQPRVNGRIYLRIEVDKTRQNIRRFQGEMFSKIVPPKGEHRFSNMEKTSG